MIHIFNISAFLNYRLKINILDTKIYFNLIRFPIWLLFVSYVTLLLLWKAMEAFLKMICFTFLRYFKKHVILRNRVTLVLYNLLRFVSSLFCLDRVRTLRTCNRLCVCNTLLIQLFISDPLQYLDVLITNIIADIITFVHLSLLALKTKARPWNKGNKGNIPFIKSYTMNGYIYLFLVNIFT